MSLGVLTRVVGPIDLQVTVDGSGGIVNINQIVDGGYNYVIGDVLPTSNMTLSGSATGGTMPSDAEFVVDGASVTGVITSLSILTPGTSAEPGIIEIIEGQQTLNGYGDEYINHTLYELGGNINEYPYGIGAGNKTSPPDPESYVMLRDGNIPSVKLERVADRPQHVVEGRVVTSGGVTVTVYSEPTVVNGYSAYNGNGYQYVTGTVVGNVVRAEDINDQNRCESLGFIWGSVTGSTGNRVPYAYCREVIPSDINWATEDADCPAGYKWNEDTGCVKQTLADVNGGGTNTQFTQAQNAAGAGYIYNYDAGAYIDPFDTTELFQPSTVQYMFPGTVTDATFPMGKVEYAKSLCRTYGWVWNKTSNQCESDASSSYNSGNYGGSVKAAKDACVAAGYVWLAGACMNPNLFGDGQARLSNQATSTKLVTPK